MVNRTIIKKGKRMIKIKRIFPLASALLVLCTFSVQAQEGTTWFGQPADGQWLVGVKLGQVSNNNPGFSNADNTTVVLGYQFAREVGVKGTASIEFEFSESDDALTNSGGFGSKWEVSTFGLFLNYRSPGTVYFKTKLGILTSDIESPTGTFASRTDSSFAYGAGIGLRLGERQNFNLELDWTGTSGDNDIDIVSLGGTIAF